LEVGSLEVGPVGSVSAGELVRTVEVTGLDAAEIRRVVGEQAAAAGLDVRAGVVMRVVWLDGGPSVPGRVLLILHHLVADGVSWRILLPDLSAAYTAVTAGRPVDLDPVGESFRAWAWQLDRQTPSRRDELAAWKDVLGRGHGFGGARDLEPGGDRAARMHHASFTVPAGVTSVLLNTVPGMFNAGVNEVLLAGFAAAVAEWRGRHERARGGLLVDVEGHGRTGGEGDISRTVGWFTCVYPVRLDVGGLEVGEVRRGGAAAGVIVKRVKEQVRSVPGDGLGFGLLRYCDVESRAALAEYPAAQVGFNYLGRFASSSPSSSDASDPNGSAGRYWQPGAMGAHGGAEMPALHALEVAAAVRDLPGRSDLTLSFGWLPEILEEAEIDQLKRLWLDMLAWIAAHAQRPGAGGHTPSDFPLAEISQDELEEFEKMAVEMEREQ